MNLYIFLLLFLFIIIIINCKCNEGFSVGFLNYNDTCEQNTNCNDDGQCKDNPCTCVIEGDYDFGNCIPIERVYLFLVNYKRNQFLLVQTFYDRSAAEDYRNKLRQGDEVYTIIVANSREEATEAVIESINESINENYCNNLKEIIDQIIIDNFFEHQKISRIIKRINRYLEFVGDPKTIIISINGVAYADAMDVNLQPGDTIVHHEYGELRIPSYDSDGIPITIENSNREFDIEHIIEVWPTGDEIDENLVGNFYTILIPENIKDLQDVIEAFKRCEKFDYYDEYLIKITIELTKYMEYEKIITRYIGTFQDDDESGPED